MNTLEKFRLTIGLTQSDLAFITGLSRQSISAIECGLWEQFPKETHLKLKPIAQDEFGFPWPDSYELLEANYQTARVDRRVLTRQTTQIATKSLVTNHRAILDTAQRTGQHPFSVWRHRAVGSISLRSFAKLIAVNPETVREFEQSNRPFSRMPTALEEALLDCGVDVGRLKRVIAEYWTVTR